jgi:pimeloyl-ACP methyl ester carboxylesterase
MLAAAALGEDKVAGACLINCAGGLTSFRLNELNPIAATLLVIFNAALFNRYTGKFFFQMFKTRENVRKVLEQAYAGGRDAVTAELVSILCQPADDEGAAEVFLAVLNGPPGPTPRDLLQSLTWCPVLVLWGNDDPFTPYARGAYPGIEFPSTSLLDVAPLVRFCFRILTAPTYRLCLLDYHPTLQLVDLGSVGHCPHDSAPTQTHRHLIPFLKDPQTFRADSHL